MADFLQTKKLYTLSDICFSEEKIDLNSYFAATIVVIIPCQVYHLENKSIFNILNKLKFIKYVTEIVVVINGNPSPDMDLVMSLKTIDPKITILLESNKNTIIIKDELRFQNTILAGKGFAIWLGYMYILQKYTSKSFIVTIDSDIQSFTSSFLLKLLYPLVQFNAEINKGYYVRYSKAKFDGRLTRFLVFPLLQAMNKQINNNELIDFLLEFRYPLSGEVAISSNLLSRFCLRHSWSYDISLLVQVHKYIDNTPIFQTELTNNYQHQHRDLTTNSNHGLMEIAKDIIDFLLGFCNFDIKAIATDYLYFARELIDKYDKLATFNGIGSNVEEEKILINEVLMLITDNQNESIVLPNWAQVNSNEVIKKFISGLIL